MCISAGCIWTWVPLGGRIRNKSPSPKGWPLMDRIERWKLADELNVYQISLLIAGYDPSEFEEDDYGRWPQEVRIEISPFLNAIKNAARSQKFTFKEVQYQTYDEPETNWNTSLVNIDSFCDWLRSRNFVDGFFRSNKESDRLIGQFWRILCPETSGEQCALGTK